ncbi:AMP-binding protein [Altererythrobacter sp. H2]|uniref:AMP-binding protein n=1 Tax=Altererythrobacter sp. H2 TaxID=3108391 RepID=UPI002B4C1F55|nr:AMP-binding protein [Altererythrobacter sp. H2]WRK95183.1 AMP-binding protein [Altererythrobacter sp. H2]
MASRFHLADLFETVARTVPDRLAVIGAHERLTFAELNDRCDRLAAGLAAHGVGRGDAVGLYLYNGPAYLEGFIAACKLGAVPYNVNYRYRADELRYLFANADSAAIIHGAEFSPVIREVRGDVPTLKVTVAVNDGSDAEISGSVPYAALLAHEPGGPWERSEDDYLLCYTGGTTGMPKGVMWPHRAFLFACAGGAGYFNPHGPLTDPSDIESRARDGYPLKLFPLAPLMHMAAMWAVWSALLNGLAIILDEGREFDAERVFDMAEREGANLIQFVGDAMATPLRDALRDNPGRWNLSGVINFGSGGAVFSQHLKDDLKALVPTAAITDGLGSSETGMSGLAEKSDEGVMRLPANAQQQIIVDGRIGVVGETGLIARTGNTPIGYYNDPVKTAETFVTIDGTLWAVSGDAGRLDADSMITVFGRGSTCINTGGEKVFPEEVEEVLRTHPAIFDAVVAGQPDPRWGERVIAVVSPRQGTAPPEYAEVKAYLAARLAGYKVPKSLVWVDEVKRSPAGKQDYRWAKQLAAEVA